MNVGWKLRMAAAQREVWTGAELRRLLAERAGTRLSAASVSALLTKQPAQVKLATLAALCTALECTPNDLFAQINRSATVPERCGLRDPSQLARREFLQDLMELAADLTPTIVLSSHLLSDVERVCDYLIVLAEGQVRLQGAVDELLANHKILTGPRRDIRSLPVDQEIVRVSHTDRQTTVVIRTTRPVLDPRWIVSGIGLEELVLAYMSPRAGDRASRALGPVPA